MTKKEEMCSFIGVLRAATHHDYDELFYSIVNKAKEILNLSDQDLRQIFGASVPTINRWLTRENCPSGPMRVGIYRTFISITEHLLEEHDGEA